MKAKFFFKNLEAMASGTNAKELAIQLAKIAENSTMNVIERDMAAAFECLAVSRSSDSLYARERRIQYEILSRIVRNREDKRIVSPHGMLKFWVFALEQRDFISEEFEREAEEASELIENGPFFALGEESLDSPILPKIVRALQSICPMTTMRSNDFLYGLRSSPVYSPLRLIARTICDKERIEFGRIDRYNEFLKDLRASYTQRKEAGELPELCKLPIDESAALESFLSDVPPTLIRESRMSMTSSSDFDVTVSRICGVIPSLKHCDWLLGELVRKAMEKTADGAGAMFIATQLVQFSDETKTDVRSEIWRQKDAIEVITPSLMRIRFRFIVDIGHVGRYEISILSDHQMAHERIHAAVFARSPNVHVEFLHL